MYQVHHRFLLHLDVLYFCRRREIDRKIYNVSPHTVCNELLWWMEQGLWVWWGSRESNSIKDLRFLCVYPYLRAKITYGGEVRGPTKKQGMGMSRKPLKNHFTHTSLYHLSDTKRDLGLMFLGKPRHLSKRFEMPFHKANMFQTSLDARCLIVLSQRYSFGEQKNIFTSCIVRN